MSKVLITGSSGLLGTALAPLLQSRGHIVTGLSRSRDSEISADLTVYEQAKHALTQVNPDVIINLIALTDVDRCEAHPHEAYLLNVRVTQNICTWISSCHPTCHLIHISTDQVYDGIGPHSEANVTIHNQYAMSKLAGELATAVVPATILRTNFVGRSLCKERTSFTDWLYGSLSAKNPITVFEDVLFSPLAIATVCDCIDRCVEERPLGVFNLGSREGMSKSDFAFAFSSLIGLSSAYLRPSTVGSVKLVARRPTDMRMHCDRFEDCMGLQLPRLIDEIYLLAHDYL